MEHRKEGESLNQYLTRRLKFLYGWQSIIAKETGVGQTTIGRIGRGDCTPRMDNAEKLLAWIEEFDKAPREKPRRVRSCAAKAKAQRGAGS